MRQFRMFSIQYAVNGYHLRLKPETELHSHFLDLLGEKSINKPSGSFSRSTNQSPKEVVIILPFFPNQPSSSTKSSIPNSRPALAINPRSFLRLKSNRLLPNCSLISGRSLSLKVSL